MTAPMAFAGSDVVAVVHREAAEIQGEGDDRTDDAAQMQDLGNEIGRADDTVVEESPNRADDDHGRLGGFQDIILKSRIVLGRPKLHDRTLHFGDCGVSFGHGVSVMAAEPRGMV